MFEMREQIQSIGDAAAREARREMPTKTIAEPRPAVAVDRWVADRFNDDELARLHSQIRGALNALGLCLRVLETAPTDREVREYARHVANTTARLERLVAQLR